MSAVHESMVGGGRGFENALYHMFNEASLKAPTTRSDVSGVSVRFHI